MVLRKPLAIDLVSGLTNGLTNGLANGLNQWFEPTACVWFNQ